jgi:hypothetical protein
METTGLIQKIENIRQEKSDQDRINPTKTHGKEPREHSRPQRPSVSPALSIGILSNNDRQSE